MDDAGDQGKRSIRPIRVADRGRLGEAHVLLVATLLATGVEHLPHYL